MQKFCRIFARVKSFRIEVRSEFPEWGRYSVYMSAVCYDSGGGMIDYVNLAGGGEAMLETPPCDHADLYLYVIAREFPASDVIAASPPFGIEVVVSPSGDTPPRVVPCRVNQWGGLSLKLKIEKEDKAGGSAAP